MSCKNCGHEVPQGKFCVRCGAELEGSAPRARSGGEFAAAPNERLDEPRLVSTLFPQLPRAEMGTFRAVLAIGVAVVAALVAGKLFPVAVVTAALLVPLLTLLYFYDVDIYEDEPIRVVLFTMIWGAAAGVFVALLSKSITTTGTGVLTESANNDLLVQSVLLPLLGIVLMLIGPIYLLRYPRFNDVLDGVTFGAATAVAFVGASVITLAAGLFDAGLKQDGAVGPWLARVLTIAVASPVLTMAAMGAAAGSLWLRYRAPVADRTKLGVFGHPAVGIVVAAGLIVAGALGEPLLSTGLWLAELIVLAGIALIWLRHAMHVGLLQEASEREIGPPIECANCGATTARHSFCSECGISLQALPKAPAAKPDARGSEPQESGA